MMAFTGACSWIQTPLASGGFWFPDRASIHAAEVDWVFYFILWVCIVFFALIVGLMGLFVWKYRRRPGVEAIPTATHSTVLELSWSVIPTFLVVIMFYLGAKGYIDMRTPPEKSTEIHVRASKWAWNFTYPNGANAPNLHVLQGRNVTLNMQSTDVLHSLFIPSFRIKMDVVPGRYTKTWFNATKPGEFQLYCTEYCGTGHSVMLAKVHVYATQQELDEKLADLANVVKPGMPFHEAGKILYETRGCAQCHSLDGTKKTGPSFKFDAGNTWGYMHEFATGDPVPYDENYVRESLLEPAKRVVKGFSPVMPSFRGQLSDLEITAIAYFIKHLNDPSENTLVPEPPKEDGQSGNAVQQQ